MRQNTLRSGAGLAIASILIVAVATSFHGGADPANLQVVLPEYAANHAVDGVAIQYVAEAWVNAPPEEKAVTFRLAETVRHIEQGLSSLVALNLGITLLLCGLAIISSRIFTKWLGWAALLVGSGYLVSGLFLNYLGFSQHVLSFWIGMLLSIWLLATALLLWRESERSVSA